MINKRKVGRSNSLNSNKMLESKIRRIVRRQLNEENESSVLEDNKEELEKIFSKLLGEKVELTFEDDGEYFELTSNYLPVGYTFFAPAFKTVRIEAVGQFNQEKNMYGFAGVKLRADYKDGRSNGFNILSGLWFDVEKNKWITKPV